MLVAAVFLGLLAVFFARTFLVPSEVKTEVAAPVVTTVPLVVAAQAFEFGEKVDAAKLKVVPWPANAVPPGSFQKVTDLVGENERVALRAIDANELITDKAVSGSGGRLSTSKLLGPDMRAMAIPINESGGAGGFLAPGDRVDVYMTRTPSGELPPYTTLLAQNARVLAVGQDSNPGKDKPEVVKTATIELTPVQAQKVALAQTVGALTVSLRPIVDEARVVLGTVRLEDLHDGRGKMVIPGVVKPAPPRAERKTTIDVEVIRGGKPTTYQLGPAS